MEKIVNLKDVCWGHKNARHMIFFGNVVRDGFSCSDDSNPVAGVELKTGKNELVEPDPIRRSVTKRAIGEADSKY